MNWELIIDITLRVGIIVMAFAWGYEKGYGKALEEETDYLEKRLKEKQDCARKQSEETCVQGSENDCTATDWENENAN